MIVNQIKTVLLLGSLTGIFLWVGSLWGPSGMTFALVFAVAMNLGAYWFSDKIVLRLYRAKEADLAKYPRLYQIVNDIAKSAKLPAPKVYILPTNTSNAFATGRNPAHAAVAVTEGILHLLSEKELKGVLAHEMAHVKNRDILISSVAATIAGVISYVAFMARWASIFGGMGRGESGKGIAELLVLAIVTPFLALLIRMAISRSREYLADETGAKLVGSSSGLASALKKLEADAKKHPLRFGSESTAHMFIVNPFTKSRFISLFSTHPLASKRIERLEKLNLSKN